MKFQIGHRLSQAILGGFLIGSSLVGYAQEDNTPGVVRISDARPRGGVAAQPASFQHKYHYGEYSDITGAYAGQCPGGNCPNCQGGYCHHKKHLFQEHYGSVSADHNFSIPGKYPIYRRGVQYNAYYPSGWYGTPQGGIAPGQAYPMVYQPTDTTQLGYYYQHVPFWTPRPNALPARPIPAQWHNLVPVAHTPWHGNWGCPFCAGHGCHRCAHGSYGGCPNGNCQAYSSGWVEGTPTTTDPSTPQSAPTILNPVPSLSPTLPNVDQSAPTLPAPPPKNDSAQNMHIRRAALQ